VAFAPPVRVAFAQPVRTHGVELVGGQVLVSGLLFTPDRAHPGRPVRLAIPEGHPVVTLKDRSATLVLGDGTKLAMGKSSRIGLGDRELRLGGGQVAVHVRKGGRGFVTVAPALTTHVMGTRYVASMRGVELVEGKVAVRVTGRAPAARPGLPDVTLNPGEGTSVPAAGQAPVARPLAKTRLVELYRFFSKLDDAASLARDLGMSSDKLLAMIQPPAGPASPAATPAAAAGPAGTTAVASPSGPAILSPTHPSEAPDDLSAPAEGTDSTGPARE
jgi:hypothetical protein